MALVSVLSKERETGLEIEAGHVEIGPLASRQRPAWMLSMVLHLTLLLVVGFVIGPAPRKAPGEQDRVAGIALVRRQDVNARYYSENSAAENAATATAASPTPLLPNVNRLPVETAFALPTGPGLEAAAASGVTMPLADGLTRANRPSDRLGAGGARTQVFGAEGLGSKFVYVFDRSASMEGFQGRPMAAAKSELIGSLRDLESVHQFQIVFYNERTSLFHPFRDQPPRMMFGSDENKQLAAEFVRRTAPAGGTRHMLALNLAIGMRPDVMFFLTDAAEPQLTSAELARIHRVNGGGTVIHTIEFGSGPSSGRDNFLAKLARQSGGQHVYVDVSELPLASAVNR